MPDKRTYSGTEKYSFNPSNTEPVLARFFLLNFDVNAATDREPGLIFFSLGVDIHVIFHTAAKKSMKKTNNVLHLSSFSQCFSLKNTGSN